MTHLEAARYYLSLHAQEPTRGDLHEVSGGSYARVARTWTEIGRDNEGRRVFMAPIEPGPITFASGETGEIRLTAADFPRISFQPPDGYCEALDDTGIDEGEGMLLEELLSPATLEWLEKVKKGKG
jgi:hypothetical protein